MDKKLNSTQWKIYNFMKEKCVGKENMMKGPEICKALNIEYSSNFKKDIYAIRNSGIITRRIGSCPKGYWLMLEHEDGLDYIKQLTTTHLKTAVKQGVPTAFFHQVLNGMEDDGVGDNQQRIMFGPYEKDVVNKYSDDLAGGPSCR